MSTVFVGGSRSISRLPPHANERLKNIVESGFPVLVGDANGADKAVQRHLLDSGYEHVTVFCSGDSCRNNLGQWKTKQVRTSKQAKGFDFYAAKDREMAREADFGLMIWDGKSAGTVLNVLRLVRANKKAVLVDTAEKKATIFKSQADWEKFLSRCSASLRHDLRERAMPEEWHAPSQQESLLNAIPEANGSAGKSKISDELATSLNAALAAGNPKAVVDLLGHIARERGMSQVAKDTGLAREGLYRALSGDGNPEFTTVMKVMKSVGFRLVANKV
jgi:probable addiction module antidote protein